jgi:hypothetical protein
LRSRFAPEVIVDMLCLLRLRAELGIRAKGMLMLREAGVLFTRASIRKLVSGPRTMGDTPVMSLDFDDGQLLEVRRRGLVARAIERRDGSWMLLRGSMLSRHIARPAAPRRPSGEWSGSIPAY